MPTVSAAEANRNFSNLLRQVAAGEEVTILSRGRPVAVMVKPESIESPGRLAAREALLERLRKQPVAVGRNWSREELYEDGTP